MCSTECHFLVLSDSVVYKQKGMFVFMLSAIMSFFSYYYFVDHKCGLYKIVQAGFRKKKLAVKKPAIMEHDC